MPTSCIIAFDNNPNKVFYGGQLLSGRVTITTTKEKTIRGLFIEITGKAYCRWTEGTGKNKKTYTGSETYLEERTFFIGDRVGERVIEPGTYEYTFECHLPYGLPTSIEGNHGHIRYSAEVVLDRPMWPDQTFEEDFTVIKPLNLNQDLNLRSPIFEEESVTFNPFCFFFCCPSKPFHMIVRAPVSGYTPGQAIQISLELENNSSEDVSGFLIQITREVKFQTHENSFNTKLEKDVIAEVTTSRGCYKAQKQKYTTEIVVPPTPPTDLTSSSICKIRYYLSIEGLVGCCHINPAILVGFTIGSYPILDDVPYAGGMPFVPNAQNSNLQLGFNVPPAPNTSYMEKNAVNPVAPSAPYPENDPPSYEQATTAAERRFNPNYPVYRRATSYSGGSKEGDTKV